MKSHILRAFITITLFVLASGATPLEGERLRCCTLIEAPNVFRDNSKPSGFDGRAIQYLYQLEKNLGFTCASIEEFRDGNQTGFTDFIFKLERCTTDGVIDTSDPSCRCDMGAAGFANNPNRIGRADFVANFANDDYRVITHVDNTATTTGGAFFITSFSIGSWMAILSLAVLFIFLKLLDRRFAPPDNDFKSLKDRSFFKRKRHYLLKSRIFFRLRKAVESTLYRMIGHASPGVQGDYNSTRQRLLNFVTALCGLFLILAYEATMTASLVQETFESEFRTIDDLRNCRIPASDVCIPGGGAVETFWKDAIATGKPCHTDQDQTGPVIVDSYNELVAKTASKECKFSFALGSTLLDAASGRDYYQVYKSISALRPVAEMMLDPQTIKRRSGENDIEKGSGWVVTTTEEAVTYPAGNVSGLLSKDIAG